MGLVKTKDEIERLQAVMSAPKALQAEMLSVVFRTRPEIVERLLPPGLEPADEPIGIANVGRVAKSNAGPFTAGSLFLKARHGDLEGEYCVALPVGEEAAVLFGREMLGEPKKLCRVEFERNGQHVRGEVFRHGRPILTIDATLQQEVPPEPFESNAFQYKAIPAADGVGLEWNPKLLYVQTENRPTSIEAGVGTLSLGESPHDPLSEIEVVGVDSAVFLRADLRARARVIADVKKEEYLPYAFARYDDWTLLDNE